MKRKSSGVPHPMDVHVGKRLRAARLLAGFSQSRLGNHVGLTFQQIQKYEKGMNRIGASRLQQFAQLLNVPPGYFFEQLNEAHASNAALNSNGANAVFPQRMPEPLAPTSVPGFAEVAAILDGRQDDGGSSHRQAVELLQHFGRIRDGALRASILHLVRTAASAYSNIS
ncbi:helix-turn-helix domain-containing protein [Ferrovibrio sp.]|uniref:helix-turn-helix domain-containing protein n=1 Tax=Ferrovibrio sp. TaxID=1917215 RepID=UPI003D108161